MPFKTKITELLGIEYPVVCGGMHYVGYAQLAAAVSNAGGLGVITALTQKTPEDLRKEIQKCKKLTSKPFGVNLTLLPALAPPNYDAYAQVLVDEGIRIVETAGRSPAKFIKFFKDNNMIVIHKCVAVRHALSAQKLGVDILSIDGYECGGHPGLEINNDDIGNFVLLAAAARKIQIPFIASGGIASPLQIVAAMALGADGVNMGTRFMATVEAPIHINIKKALVRGDERSTTHIMKTLKNTERVYKNKTTMKIREIEKEKPGDISAIYHLVRGENYRKSFQETGDSENSAWSCGLSMAFIDDIPTCKDLIRRIFSEAEYIIKNRINNMIVSKL